MQIKDSPGTDLVSTINAIARYSFVYRRNKDLYKKRWKKKRQKIDLKKCNLHYILIFFLNQVINNVVKIFIIKYNLFCQLPADFFYSWRDLSFSNALWLDNLGNKLYLITSICD